MAEIGDFRRFANPHELMALARSGAAQAFLRHQPTRGAITKAGNGRARRALVEGAWIYRLPARISPESLRSDTSASQPAAVREVAWKVRSCGRYRRLVRTGKPANVITDAIARELAAFVWVIVITVMPPIETRADATAPRRQCLQPQGIMQERQRDRSHGRTRHQCGRT